jgi:hypothetical protein
MGMVSAIALFWSNEPNPAINHLLVPLADDKKKWRGEGSLIALRGAPLNEGTDMVRAWVHHQTAQIRTYIEGGSVNRCFKTPVIIANRALPGTEKGYLENRAAETSRLSSYRVFSQ